MANTTIESLHGDIDVLKREVLLIKHLLAEDFELSEKAKRELAKARTTPKERYISHEDAKNRFL